MTKKAKYFQPTLSAKLGLWVVAIVTILFVVIFSVVFYYARRSVKEEAIAVAQQALETTVLNVDNALHRVEVAVDGMKRNVELHLDHPDSMYFYSRQALEDNPVMMGCAITFVPGFYAQKDGLFMAYHHRQGDSVVQASHFGNVPYTEQAWFTKPLRRNAATWIEPSIEMRTNGHPIASYSVPIHRKGKAVGVLSCDISLRWLTDLVQATRPFPRTFCAVLAKGGSFLVHPDTAQLVEGAVFKQLDHWPGDREQFKKLARAMLNGETGYMKVNFFGYDNYVFYKPFKNTDWSVDITCPETELMSGFHQLQRDIVPFVAGGLLVIFVFCLVYVCWSLRPLRGLAASAQHIASGDYSWPISESRRKDEVGVLQNNFRSMQRSLVAYLAEIEHENADLQQQRVALRTANERVQEADRVQSDFLSHVTGQMNRPLSDISSRVDYIRRHHGEMEQDEMCQHADEIQRQTMVVTGLLDEVLQQTIKKGGTKG